VVVGTVGMVVMVVGVEVTMVVATDKIKSNNYYKEKYFLLASSCMPL
jgi:uncharacterized membrane protein